jgi:hypothetical protein
LAVGATCRRHVGNFLSQVRWNSLDSQGLVRKTRLRSRVY